ncbi:MAG: CDP-diacylglycerol--glycerol-3-phosphate 3-phosphatidyltransferase [Myxococcales bacterium]|nr:CDP-diacylglycerol--glycerol-3-phosphate 3-phosphatidyltransferase [Myxococcales bacterium]
MGATQSNVNRQGGLSGDDPSAGPGALHRRASPYNIANLVTILRVAFVPLIVWLLHDPTPLTSALAALVFALASVTDALDGYLARKFNLQSALGAFLDPLADKLLVMAVLIMLVSLDRVGPVLPIVILTRELFVTGLRSIAVEEGVVIPAGELGKYKMLLQIFAIFSLCMHHNYFGVDFHFGGMYYLWLATILAIWSGVEYTVNFLRELQATRA